MAEGFVGEDGGGGGGVSGIHLAEHGDFYFCLGGGEPGFGQAVVFAADNERGGLAEISCMIKLIGLGGGGGEVELFFF